MIRVMGGSTGKGLQLGAEHAQKETLRILSEAAPGDRFLIGITEDMPENAWRASLSTISQALLQHGALPLPYPDKASVHP